MKNPQAFNPEPAPLRIVDIIPGTSVDGPGLRTAIYFAGCAHQCPECHNPLTWNFEAGKTMSADEIMNIIKLNDFNVTFSGGDPLYQIEALVNLAQRIKEELGKNIWCYTGFTYEEVYASPKFSILLDWIDVLVDGPFIRDLKDLSLRFRGSSNQRLIDCRRTIFPDKIQLWEQEVNY